MAAIFFEHFLGKDAPVTDASTIMFFRDHLTFLDEVLSEEKRKMGLLDLAGQLKLKQEAFGKSRGIKLHGELKDRKGSEGNLPLHRHRELCPAGAAQRGLGFAYSARRRHGLRGLWYRHDGCL